MKFSEGIKIGAAVYIGWTITEAIDDCLGKQFNNSKIGKELITKYNEKNASKEDTNEDRIIGFHAE